MDFSSFNQRRTCPLSYAARTGDLVTLKKLLKKRSCDVNYNDNRGWTALHEAAAHDQVEAAKMILGHKSCRPDVKSHDGKTALFVALVAKCSMDIMNLLLTIKGVVNASTNEDVTPLHVAARQGRMEAAVTLIRAGANINKADFDGDTPLHEASHCGHSELVSLLLHCGCNPEPKNDQKFTPLHLACMLPTSEIADLLLMFTTEINCYTSDCDTPLSLAAQKSSLQTVQLLLKNGATPHLSASEGCVPLYHSMLNADVDVFKLLLENTDHAEINFDIIRMGADPTIFNTRIFEELLKSDLGPEFFNIEYTEHHVVYPPLSPFFKVADYLYTSNMDNFESLFMMFLMRGMPVNAVHSRELAPLSVLFQCVLRRECGHEVFRILVDHGANVDYFGGVGGKRTIPEVFENYLHHLAFCQFDCSVIFQHSIAIEPEQIAATDLLIHRDLANFCSSNSIFTINLRHFCRLAIRKQLRLTGTVSTTHSFLSTLYKLPLPAILCDYLRYIE